MYIINRPNHLHQYIIISAAFNNTKLIQLDKFPAEWSKSLKLKNLSCIAVKKQVRLKNDVQNNLSNFPGPIINSIKTLTESIPKLDIPWINKLSIFNKKTIISYFIFSK